MLDYGLRGCPQHLFELLGQLAANSHFFARPDILNGGQSIQDAVAGFVKDHGVVELAQLFQAVTPGYRLVRQEAFEYELMRRLPGEDKRVDQRCRTRDQSHWNTVGYRQIDQVIARVKNPGRAGIGDQGDILAFFKKLDQVFRLDQAVMLKETGGGGVDGIMIGRASVGRPWIFRDIKHFLSTGELLPEPTTVEKAVLALMHFEKSLEFKEGKRAILEMRRHLSNYFKGLPHFRDTRLRLLTSNEPDEIRTIIKETGDKYGNFRTEERTSVYAI